MANRIMLNQTSYHGAGAIAEIATEAKAHGFKKALVCSDPDLIKFNVTSKVTDILDKEGLAYEIYSDIKANPTIENVQHGVQAFKNSGADYIFKFRVCDDDTDCFGSIHRRTTTDCNDVIRKMQV